MSEIERRTLMQGGALGALAFLVGGTEVWLTPREAYAQKAAMGVLKPDEVETLEAIGETLLPGARQSGIANFVDHQLGVAPGDCLLMARIANVRPPFANFYHGALAAIEQASLASGNKRFAQRSAAEQYDFVDHMRQNKLDAWQGPPAPFIYFLLRHDAVDVTYGTVAGIEGLGIPYMPHILPTERW
jgi:hypothetical protein